MNLENLIATAKSVQIVQESEQETPVKTGFIDSDGKEIEVDDIILIYDTKAGIFMFRFVSVEDGEFILKSPDKVGGYLKKMMENKGRFYIKVVGNMKTCAFPQE
ncbi:TPA: hypothetical protein SFZ49_001908 [Campylobacter jejuni]|nr:hypothetical protein [Campylobacter jejuni]HEG8097792.1 hypothetical protein [Campylobacter jejuni]